MIKMRIAMFTDTYAPEINGVTTSLKFSSRLLTNKGHVVEIHAPKIGKTKQNKTRIDKIEGGSGIIVHRYSGFRVPRYRQKTLAYPHPFRAYNLLKRFKPDIVHIHTPGFMGLVGVLCAKRLRVPMVATYHTYLPDFLMYASVLSIRPRKGFMLNVAWWLTKYIHNKAKVNTCPSNSIRKELIKHGVKRVKTVSNGVNVQMFKPKKKYSKKPMKFLHVGRLGHEKRAEILLYAFKKALLQNSDLRLTVIGDGPALRRLKRLSHRLELDEAVNFKGFVSFEDLPKEYARHDVFVTPSPMETQGLVILEAMACGLPVIAVDRLAPPEIVDHGKSGLICKPGDADQMAECILRMTDASLVRKFGRESVKIARTHDVRRIVDALEEIYFNIAKK